MAGKPPPPTSKAPVSRETVEVVRKKISAPSGPPPAGMMTNFSAPKSVSANDRHQYKRGGRHDDEDEEEEEEDDRDYSDRRRPSSDSRSRNDSRDREYVAESRYQDDHRKGNGVGVAESRHRRSSEFEDPEDGGRRYYEDEEEVDDQEEDEEEEEYEDRDIRAGKRGGVKDEGSDARRLKPTYDDLPSPVKAENLPEARYAHSKDGGAIPVATAQPLLSAKEVHSSTYTPANSQSKASGGAQGKLTIYHFQRLLSSTYRELKNFVMNPAPPGVIVRCYIERNRSGSYRLAPMYSLCADLEGKHSSLKTHFILIPALLLIDGTGRELMVCKKIIKSRTSHYVFSLKSEDLYRKREQRSRLYLGKLRAVSNNDYVLYDNGICAAPEDPDSLLEALESDDHDGSSRPSVRDTALAKKMERDLKEQQEKSGDDVSLYRRELAVIHFNSKTRPSPAGTRGMEVCVPIEPNHSPAVAESKSTTSSSSSSSVFNIVKPFERLRLAQKQNVMFRKTCLVMHEKTSRYDPLSSCLVDFRGRAHMASVKNFQLLVSDPMSNYPTNPSAAQEMLLQHDAEAEFILQLGKVRHSMSDVIRFSKFI